MTVPTSKRTKAKSEYANQARIVLYATRNLFRKWPKSRDNIETIHVMHIAYDMYTAAYSADTIYASTLEEHKMKLQLLCKAQGMLNALSGLVDDWIAAMNLRHKGYDLLNSQYATSMTDSVRVQSTTL